MNFSSNYFSKDAHQAKVELYDAFGRRMNESKLSMENSQAFYRMSFPAGANDGIYFIVVTDDLGNLKTERIIKRSNTNNGQDDD